MSTISLGPQVQWAAHTYQFIAYTGRKQDL